MPKVEIPDVPKELYDRIVELARSKDVSLGEEVLEILAKGYEADFLAEVRRDREELKHIYLTDEQINDAKRWGREDGNGI